MSKGSRSLLLSYDDFPVLAIPGGVVLNPAYYGMHGHTNTMIHEVGHVLGLYHVFKGVSERESCDDPCRETTPSMETGDLCADTAPTPKSKLCRDPDPTNDTCGQTLFTGTPFNNYMSYTGEEQSLLEMGRGDLCEKLGFLSLLPCSPANVLPPGARGYDCRNLIAPLLLWFPSLPACLPVALWKCTEAALPSCWHMLVLLS